MWVTVRTGDVSEDSGKISSGLEVTSPALHVRATCPGSHVARSPLGWAVALNHVCICVEGDTPIGCHHVHRSAVLTSCFRRCSSSVPRLTNTFAGAFFCRAYHRVLRVWGLNTRAQPRPGYWAGIGPSSSERGGVPSDGRRCPRHVGQ